MPVDGGDRGDAGDDRRWPDPAVDARDRVGLGARVACSLVVCAIVVWLTRGFLLEAIPRLWPPTEPISQWATLVTLHAFGYVLVPLMIGSALADFLVDRVQNETE